MPKESVLLQVRMSPKLKQDFKTLCDEDETAISDKVRELIAIFVRSRKRQSGKTDKSEAN